MAVPTGSGTETVHSHLFADVDGQQKLIVGAQHHVYTVLSIIIYCNALNAISDTILCRFVCWDGHAGGSGAEPLLFKANPRVGETFVWDNKFSFFGHEPTGSSGTFSDTTEQAAMAAQGSGTAQSLECTTTHADDDYDVCITYIDQDFS